MRHSSTSASDAEHHDAYRAAVAQLLSLADFERKSRADQPPDWHRARVARLLNMLGDPHLAKPVVHVAGSKGKGSTAALIASALTANGYRTGIYSSPHLHRFTERIAVDRTPISEPDFAALIYHLWQHVESIRDAGDIGEVSVFELLTAMAFVHFAEQARVDVAVIEVGLGGRLDATNLVQPAVSVITPISLDHVAVLGNTIAAIASEKAGIIKPDTPVVIGRQTADAARVIARRAEQLAAPLHDAMADTSLVPPASANGTGAESGAPRAIAANAFGEIAYRPRALGEHQLDNARTAVTALQVLTSAGFELDAPSIARGIATTSLPCRTERLPWHGSNRCLLVDGAHNDASAHALRQTITTAIPETERQNVCIVLGATSGHDVRAVAHELAQLAPAPTHAIATTSRHPKALDAEHVARAANASGLQVVATRRNVAAAMRVAASLTDAGDADLVVATGSLFVAAEAREFALGIEPELYPDMPPGYMQPYQPSTTESRRDLN